MSQKTFRVTVLPGDGVGPEVLREAVRVLRSVGESSGAEFSIREALVGGAALDAAGTPLPKETLDQCAASDAVLLGAVGGPSWDDRPPHLRPEQGLLSLRKQLGLYANLRPIRIYPSLIDCSTLKPEVVRNVDLLIVRELTGGLYFGTPRGVRGADGDERGVNTMEYSRSEIERIAAVAFDLARRRRRKVCSVDKANVLEVSQLWRKIISEVGSRYPDVELAHMYVDNCAMQLVRNPGQFDVLVTENMFGDILSDEAAMITGSIGLLPSASLGGKTGLYEPVHGSAPDIAGQGKANPIAAIASVAMMLRFSFGLEKEAASIERAIELTLEQGFRPMDICRDGARSPSTREMGDTIVANLERTSVGLMS
jgi:3-isopropylmalate dehydrogenase